MGDLEALYTDMIMEESRARHNRRELEEPHIIEDGHNPTCGDEIKLYATFDGDIISDLSFTGEGCAISQASTSMMIDLIKGKSKEEADRLIETFLGMIKREEIPEELLLELEDSIAFQNICNMPARVKCALLAWRTLQQAIKE